MKKKSEELTITHQSQIAIRKKSSDEARNELLRMKDKYQELEKKLKKEGEITHLMKSVKEQVEKANEGEIEGFKKTMEDLREDAKKKSRLHQDESVFTFFFLSALFLSSRTDPQFVIVTMW